MLIDRDLVRHAVEELWVEPRVCDGSLRSRPSFLRLVDACRKADPSAGDASMLAFALERALTALGLPAALSCKRTSLASTPDVVAGGLVRALDQTQVRQVHLCPLDLADDLPPLSFGPCEVRKFSSGELADLFSRAVLERSFAGATLDTERFSRFTWLVVRETVSVPADPCRRAAPFLYQDMRTDWGAIVPHASKLPDAAEKALFFTILEPWEEWSALAGHWTPFQIPWTYTSSEDVFAHRRFPLSPDSLTWQPEFGPDPEGDTVEFQSPVKLPLAETASQIATSLNDRNWATLQAALASPLFETPVVHFFVRAFLADGMDEFLAHMTAIEAALGQRNDFRLNEAARKHLPKGRRSPSGVVATRVGALLRSDGDAERYERLFDRRSEYLHGRAMAQSVPSECRLACRSLARRVVTALLKAADEQPVPISREDYLSRLLTPG